MAFADARVLPGVTVSWEILAMVIRIEGVELIPQLEQLTVDLALLQEDYTTLNETLTDLSTKVDQLLADATKLRLDTIPTWDDGYNLCGDPHCDGYCRICEEGEEDYEDVYVEKYCRRGKR
jgi:hypothetical protein